MISAKGWQVWRCMLFLRNINIVEVKHRKVEELLKARDQKVMVGLEGNLQSTTPDPRTRTQHKN